MSKKKVPEDKCPYCMGKMTTKRVFVIKTCANPSHPWMVSHDRNNSQHRSFQYRIPAAMLDFEIKEKGPRMP